MSDFHEKFQNFLYSFGANKVLIAKAAEDGCFIEIIILQASAVDAFLRIGLVLKRQIDNDHVEIDDELIAQESSGSFYSERQIYQMSLDEGVIDQETFDELGELYDARNQILHRFFISSIQYNDLVPFFLRYKEMYEKLHDRVYALETEQIESGRGMTSGERPSNADEIFADMSDRIFEKISKEESPIRTVFEKFYEESMEEEA